VNTGIENAEAVMI